ncbi:PIR protein CIR protein [Plasmodium vinckei lentum]|uniref:PIR protein CIR protein n=1 Tax=Plasmodium vinckei lentum TaxID=138297 RepID=A0A6V7SSW7_PLAVN|nr:PIR protein CIR protein [Plasmodium vinckei lentum]
MGMKACNTFSDIDALFTSYEANEDEFNNEDGSYNKYCPGKNGSQICKTDYEKLGAVFGYAYVELMQNKKVDLDSENDLSADFLVMAFSNILYKLSKNHSLSLKDAFKEYLSNQGSFNYSSIFYNKNYFSDSNIGIMNGFYFLFQQICETINTYNKSKAQKHEHIIDIAQCYIIYDTLYKFINHCGPYLQLLSHLKAIYDEFKKSVIKDNDESVLTKLIELSPIDKTTFESGFESPECKQMNKKLEQNISRIKNKPQEEHNEFSALIELLGSDDEDSEDGDENGDLGNNDIRTNSLNQEQDGHQGKPTVSKPASEKLPPTPPQALQKSGESPQSGTKDSDKGPGDSKSEKTGSGTQKENSDSENGGSGSGSSGGPGSSGGGKESEPKAPRDQDVTDPSEKSNGSWTSLWGTSLNPMNYMPSVSSIYQASKDVLISTTNKISDTYTNTMGIVKGAYDKTVTTVKDAYTASTNYISGAVSSITNQFNPFSISSQLGGNQSVFNSSGSGVDTPNHSQQNSSQTSPPSVTPPSTQQSMQQSTPPLVPRLSQTPSEMSQNSLPSPSSKEQTNLPQLSQDSPGSQNYDQNHQGGSKTPVAIPVVKQEDTGPEVKGNKTTGIGDIYALKEYKQIGISIIVLLIPITLAIMHKYLSSGWRKEMKRKKNMKKIINSIGGKRSVQIIISSSSRKKQTKKSINSVYRRKPPLLNIYKLMQANPVPFINLFFLLIFFVYKRKYDFLEL